MTQLYRTVKKYKFLGSMFTDDLKLDEEIQNRRNTMLGNLNQYKDAISSKHLSLAFRKLIVRVCLDESLFYGAETMTLNGSNETYNKIGPTPSPYWWTTHT